MEPNAPAPPSRFRPRAVVPVLGLVSLLAAPAAPAAAEHHAGPHAAGEASPADAALAAYDDLLGRHVDGEGLVDYAGLADDADARPALRGVRALAAEADLKMMPIDRRLALLINTYNAAVLDVLLAHGAGTDGGVESILAIEDGKVFDTPRIDLGGSTVSLNELEKERIQPLAGDARYHFAVNCGAYSCPPLRRSAYTEGGIQRELDEQRAASLTTDAPRFLRWNGGGAVEVTKLMDWYADEFGDPAAYLNAHAELPGPAESVSFLEYDWALNAQ